MWIKMNVKIKLDKNILRNNCFIKYLERSQAQWFDTDSCTEEYNYLHVKFLFLLDWDQFQCFQFENNLIDFFLLHRKIKSNFISVLKRNQNYQFRILAREIIIIKINLTNIFRKIFYNLSRHFSGRWFDTDSCKQK